jgi:hypothetical protein
LPAFAVLLTASSASAQSYTPVDPSTWHRDAMWWNVSPVDLSYLNHKPAGR